MTATITGVKALDIRFTNMKRSLQRKIVKKAMTQGTKEVGKAIKRALPSSWKGAKKTIGQRVNRPGKGRFKGVTFAKAGAGVGMSKKRRDKMRTTSGIQRATQNTKKRRKGVGIGVSNIMWFLEGTDPRYTGTKRVGAHRLGVKNRRVDTGNTKRYTGKLAKSGIMQKAYRASAHLANQLIMSELMAGIMREAKTR